MHHQFFTSRLRVHDSTREDNQIFGVDLRIFEDDEHARWLEIVDDRVVADLALTERRLLHVLVANGVTSGEDLALKDVLVPVGVGARVRITGRVGEVASKVHTLTVRSRCRRQTTREATTANNRLNKLCRYRPNSGNMLQGSLAVGSLKILNSPFWEVMTLIGEMATSYRNKF